MQAAISEGRLPKSIPSSSEQSDIISELRQAIDRGEWEIARLAAGKLALEAPPESAGELRVRADTLIELLNAARVARSHLVSNLARVRAANRFRGDTPERQNSVEPISF